MPMFNQSPVSGGIFDAGRIALIGCSYEDFNGIQVLGTSTYLQQTGYATWAQVAIPGLQVDNYGVSGQTTSQVCARVDSVLAATRAGIVLMAHGAENDVQNLSSASTATAVAQANADYVLWADVCTKIKTTGRKLIARTPSNRKGTTTTAQKQYLATFAKLIRSWCAANGVPVLDIHAIVTNPSTGVACLAGEYGWAADAIHTDTTHLSASAAVIVGGVLATIVAQMMPASVYGPPGYAADLYSTSVPDGNFLGNPKMLGTAGSVAGGASGQVADGWTLTATTMPSGGAIVGSKVIDGRATSRGEWQQISMTGTSKGIAQLWRAGFISGLAGRVMEMSGEVQCDAAGWGAGGIGTCYQLSVTFYNDAYASVGYSTVFPDVTAQPNIALPSGKLAINRVNVPVGATSWILSCRLFGVGTVRFTNVDFRLKPA